MSVRLCILAALILAMAPFAPERALAEDIWRIAYERKTTTRSGMSRSNSQSRGALIERVVARRNGGLELEYDMTTEPEERRGAARWMFPVRVFKVPGQPFVLLNEERIDARLQRYLDAAPRLRALCGRHIFTWRAVHIECEASAALDAVAPYDLRPGKLEAGRMVSEPDTLRPAPLRLVANGPDGHTFTVRFALDPQVLREGDARMRIALAQMTGQPVPSLAEALATLGDRRYAGTLDVTFRTDTNGRVTSRVRDTAIEVAAPGGEPERRTIHETVRRLRPEASEPAGGDNMPAVSSP